MTNNPSYQGWIFELEVIVTIKNFSDCSNEWVCGENGKYFNVFDASNIPAEIADNSWILPTTFNQGGFDLIYYRSAGVVEAIQVTRAERHVNKMHFLAPFIEKLKSEDKCLVQFTVVVPESVAPRFQFFFADFSSLNAIKKFDNRWVGGNISSFARLLFCENSKFGKLYTEKLNLQNLNISESESSWVSTRSMTKKRLFNSDLPEEEDEEEHSSYEQK
jgi:hypothetical protein